MGCPPMSMRSRDFWGGVSCDPQGHHPLLPIPPSPPLWDSEWGGQMGGTNGVPIRVHEVT